MSTQPQPAPVLAWHKIADKESNAAARAIVGHVEAKTGKSLSIEDCVKITMCVRLAIDTVRRAAHDPHQAQHATTVRLLEDMIESARHWIREANRGGAEFNWEAETYEARAHLVSNPQQEGAAK